MILPHPASPGPGHLLAAGIRGSELVELPELRGLYTWVDDDVHRATMEATGRFVSRLTDRGMAERVLATVLFTDIVGSTELAVRVGDTAWREILERHHAIVRRELARCGGLRRGEQRDPWSSSDCDVYPESVDFDSSGIA